MCSTMTVIFTNVKNETRLGALEQFPSGAFNGKSDRNEHSMDNVAQPVSYISEIQF